MRSIPPGLPPWRVVLYDGHSLPLAESAETFFRIAIEPSCRAIADKLASIPSELDQASAAQRNQLREVQLELHRSFALAMGGQWERHFQRHLARSASVIRPGETAVSEKIEKGSWKNLKEQFEIVRGFPLEKLPCYDQLFLLHQVSSAGRHGNGNATRTLYKHHKELFSYNPITSWFRYSTYGGEPEHSIIRLEIKFEHLVNFKDAIVEFWQTIHALSASASAYKKKAEPPGPALSKPR